MSLELPTIRWPVLNEWSNRSQQTLLLMSMTRDVVVIIVCLLFVFLSLKRDKNEKERKTTTTIFPCLNFDWLCRMMSVIVALVTVPSMVVLWQTTIFINQFFESVIGCLCIRFWSVTMNVQLLSTSFRKGQFSWWLFIFVYSYIIRTAINTVENQFKFYVKIAFVFRRNLI